MLLIIFHLVLYAFAGITFFTNTERTNNTLQFAIHALLGIVLGLGISSCLFFIFLVASWSFYLQPCLEILIYGSLIFFSIRKNKISFSDFNVVKDSALSLLKKPNQPAVFFLLLFFTVIAYSFVYQLYQPSGAWDAFAIWNTQARLLYREEGSYWTNLFHGNYSHPDYPLLLAGLIAHWWFMLGHETNYAPLVIAVLQVALISLLLFCVLSRVKSILHGTLAALVLTSTPFFVDHGSSQYADTLLSLFFLTSCIFLFMAERSETYDRKYLIMAGLTGGLSVWTKNEGILFLLALVASQFLFLKNFKLFVKRVTDLAIGALPVLIIVIYFKVTFAPPNDIIGSQSVAVFEKLTDPARYYYILVRFLKIFLSLGHEVISPFVVLLIYALIAGRDQMFPYKSYRQMILIVVVAGCGYFMIYVVTPLDLKQHLDFSLDRLMIQLLPMIVFGSFLYFKKLDDFFKSV